ncbi:MAG: cbb3-type cytochrome c oxidase subunit I [Thermoanaerobaculia bacterium]|nr:cbb3-type cytochrome c oxidase subunit I [Thermoanaerobaculia bacterium]
MTSPSDLSLAPERALTRGRVVVHSLLWLTVGNTVGLLLASLLLWPTLGQFLEPLSYGRWVPVHLDLQLYGWSALPLVGLLLLWYLPLEDGDGSAKFALEVWSGALLFGALSTLAGGSGGKLFLEWSGAARWVFLGTLVVLWAVLARCLYLRWSRGGKRGNAGLRGRVGIQAVTLLLLALVPPVLWIASGAAVYPPINPDSGGATGTSLLGSSLGIVSLFLATPWILGLELRGSSRVQAVLASLLGLHFLGFLLLPHGDQSHHELLQTFGLASLVLWLPLVAVALRGFSWPTGARRWLLGMGVWGGLLVTTAVTTFLPGFLEAFKFTDWLVAHAHLAMAGLVTSFNGLVLLVVARGTPWSEVLAAPIPFWMWQGGCALLVSSLAWAGFRESSFPGGLAIVDIVVQRLYLARWGAGLLMTLASMIWLRDALGRSGPEDSRR